MIFKNNQPTIDEKAIAENYLRNLSQNEFQKTIEIIEVYRKADENVRQIEQKYFEKIEADFDLFYIKSPD